MKRKQFTFYSSYWDAIQPLPKKQQAEILLAICDYALNETEPSSSLSPAIWSPPQMPTYHAPFFTASRIFRGRNKAANRQNISESNV